MPSSEGAATDASQTYREPPPVAKGLAFFVVGLLAMHFVVTFLFNAPSNPIKQSVSGEVNGYMRPFFQQNWSLFAPNPISSEDTFEVRARIVDAQTGAERVTDWVSATEYEWALVHHSVAPSRASRLSSNLHRRLHRAWDDLNGDQREIVARDFDAMPNWTPLADELIEAQGGKTSRVVANVVRGDRVATGYTTQVARALWGSEVRAVQFRLRRTPVPRWDARFDPVPVDPSGTVRDFGWRPVLSNDGQSDEAFEAAFERFEP